MLEPLIVYLYYKPFKYGQATAESEKSLELLRTYVQVFPIDFNFCAS